VNAPKTRAFRVLDFAGRVTTPPADRRRLPRKNAAAGSNDGDSVYMNGTGKSKREFRLRFLYMNRTPRHIFCRPCCRNSCGDSGGPTSQTVRTGHINQLVAGRRSGSRLRTGRP